MKDLFQQLEYVHQVEPPADLESRILQSIRQNKLNQVSYFKVAVAACFLILLLTIEIRWSQQQSSKQSLSEDASFFQLNVNNNLYHETK